MPNFAIRSTPSQISQTGTQDALIRNTGSSSVYLDAYSSVSPDNYGLELQPMDSVNWAQGRDLWAVTSAGNESTLSVLYGADGVSLGAVSAVVTGDVTATITGPVDANITNASIPVTGDVNANITNAMLDVQGDVNATITNADIDVNVQGTVPVDIQNAVINADVSGNIIVDSGEVNVGGILTPVTISGGGQQLYSQIRNVPASGTLLTTVSIPAGAPTYYGIKIYLEITNATGVAARPVVARDLFGNTTVLARHATGDNLLGQPHIHEYTVPMQSNTYDLYLDNLVATTTTVLVTITGVNVSAPTAQTNMSRLFRNSFPVSFTPGTVGTDPTLQAWLSPSFQPYGVFLRCNSTSGVLNTMQLNYLDYIGGSDQWTQRAWNVPNYPDPVGTSTPPWALLGPLNRFIPIAGNARASRINIPPVSTNNGSIQLNVSSAIN